ncbi:MAG: ATP synthase subunit I [Actinomycetes bacterium]
MADQPVSYVEGSPEVDIATDMVRRALPVAPILVLICGLIWGIDGALSSAFGIGIVLVNFMVTAAVLSWSARISPTMLMAATLGGFIVRMALIVGAVMLVKGTSWASLVPLLLTVLVTHLGLLIWETRYVSMSLAFPGLKPQKGA